MNKLYKVFFAIFLVVSLLTLTGCGSSGGGNKYIPPQAISEMTAARLSVGTVVSNITGIIGHTPSSVREVRASIAVPDKLKNLAKGEIINKIIPANSRNEFLKGLGPEPEKKEEWIQNTKYLKGSDNDSYNTLVVGTCDKYEENQRYNVALFEGKEGAGTILTKVIAIPDTAPAIAISYLDDGNGNKSTLVFVISKDGIFEGRIFKGTNDTATYDSDSYTSLVYGKEDQMTYQNDETFEVVKFDGTSVTSSSTLIEGFKSSLYALKFGGELRTGQDGQSDSAIVKENRLTFIPPSLYNLSSGEVLDEYMNYSTIEAFNNDTNIINKFMPKKLENYESVKIGDYNNDKQIYYKGPTATATLRLALSVIDKDFAHIVTKVAGQDNGLYIVSVSYLTINNKEYTVAAAGQMIRDSKGIFLEAKMFEGKKNDVNYQSSGEIGTAKIDYKSEEDIPASITVNGKTVTFNAAE